MGEQILPKDIPHLHSREDKPSETNVVEQKSASLSVAQLAGKFQDQPPVSGKETPANKPTRRKPPCSLPLHAHKTEPGQNGDLKPSPNTSHPPKVKVKSSPMIEKLQANLAFAPTSLLPGASPKSPGLKAMVSPFNSPPTTPSSPQIQSHANESKETPVSFDQPPEGTHLQFYNKVRTRGSMKRRPPSRRFRKSQSECDDQDFGVTVSPQENGAKEEDDDDGIFKTVKSLSPSVDGINHNVKQNRSTSDEKPLSCQRSGRTENREREMGTEKGTLDKDSGEEKPHQNLAEENPCENLKEEKERNPGSSTPENTEGKSSKSSLLDRKDDNGSDQGNKDEGERGDNFCESENTQQESDKQNTGTPQPAGDIETTASMSV